MSTEAATYALLDVYADAGVDILEVGIPTRDPWLDGAEVRESMARALDAGWDAFASARVLGAWRDERVGRGASVPAILWFSYPDLPLDALRDGAAAGAVDALLMLAEHRHAVGAALPGELARLGVARCAFLPWDPEPSDLAAAADATGYVMVQARPGVTGADGPAADPTPLVRMARAAAPSQPVVTGFGISGPDDVRRILASGIDGVISGSACVRALRLEGIDGLRAHLGSLVEAAHRSARVGATQHGAA
ncbi:MAG: tryptophan synthase subunit alpha [Chloroflexi bacterium]|nr:tryptophan synthase subunit alpha [Chloroflexota bacterium]